MISDHMMTIEVVQLAALMAQMIEGPVELQVPAVATTITAVTIDEVEPAMEDTVIDTKKK